MRVLRCAVLAALAAAATVAAQPRGGDGGRVVAIGDVHGSLSGLVEILKAAGLVDEARHWIGGTTTLVQTGDLTDRGAEVRGVLDLMMALEKEAPKAKGKVEQVIGNHEVMNLLGDLRDATPDICAAFADSGSATTRERAWRDYEQLIAARARTRPNETPAGLHPHQRVVARGLSGRAASNTARRSARAARTDDGCADGRSPPRSATACSCTPGPNPATVVTRGRTERQGEAGDRALRSVPAAPGGRTDWRGHGSASRTSWPSPPPRCGGPARSWRPPKRRARRRISKASTSSWCARPARSCRSARGRCSPATGRCGTAATRSPTTKRCRRRSPGCSTAGRSAGSSSATP